MTVQNLVAGESIDPIFDKSFDRENPHTGEVVGPGFSTSPEDIELALTTAWAAYSGGYADLAPEERAAYVDRMADCLENWVDSIASTEALVTGVPIAQTKPLAEVVPFAFRKAAEHARSHGADRSFSEPGSEVKLLNRAWGPALCLTPWNAPTPLAAHKVASALAAGAPVILKPSELVPEGPNFLIRAALEADLPSGLFQLLNGDSKVGARLVRDNRIKSISFTGGLKAGQMIGAEALKRMCPLQFELGGHNPMVVLPGADLAIAAKDLLLGLTTINGQWCRAVGRLLVHKSIWGDLRHEIFKVAAALNIGDPTDMNSEMGPLVHSKQRQLLEAEIEERRHAGANVLPLVERQFGCGHYMVPTLLTNVPRSLDLEELFGPIACVHTFTDHEEALDIVHEAPHGLAGYVFGTPGRDLERFASRIRAGSIKINGVSLRALSPHAPRTAWGVSGLGEEGIRETYEFFQGVRVVGYTR